MVVRKVCLIVVCCSALATAQNAGRRRAGDPPIRSQPPVQTSECPSEPVVEPSTDAPSGGDYVELERTQCFGSCPAYQVRIYADGRVEWNGKSHVQVAGQRSGQITPESARSLIEKFRDAGFWRLCAKYDRIITDLPSAITVIHLGSSDKSVSDRAQSAPDWLRDLDRSIDEVADTHAWIHGDPQREPLSSVLADVSGPKPGLTALMQAAGRGDLQEVERRLSLKEDPNARDSSGATAVIYATRAATPDVLTALMRAGADPNIRTYAGATAVMAATLAYQVPEEKLRFLLAAGADVNVQDQNGQTALMLAVRYQFEQPEVVALLVNSGARRDIKDTGGLRALDRVEKDPRRTKLPAQYERLRQILGAQ